MHADLEKLCDNARNYGSVKAVYMSSHGVVLDPRVRLKCMVPRCANYGHNLMCPPNVMSAEEFKLALKKYQHVVVVQYPIPLDTEYMKRFKERTISEVVEDKEYLSKIRTSEKEFMDMLGRLERDALTMGYRFATALSGGACKLCDECVGQSSGERCRHPFRSRPSMEAMGIDVFATAKAAGVPFDIPVKDSPVWTGLLLVD